MKNTFDVDCRDGCTQKQGGEKFAEEGSVSGDCKDDFMNK